MRTGFYHKFLNCFLFLFLHKTPFLFFFKIKIKVKVIYKIKILHCLLNMNLMLQM